VSNEFLGFNSVNQTEQNLTAGQKTAVFGSKRCRIADGLIKSLHNITYQTFGTILIPSVQD
jgi:hypothetical protein